MHAPRRDFAQAARRTSHLSGRIIDVITMLADALLPVTNVVARHRDERCCSTHRRRAIDRSEITAWAHRSSRADRPGDLPIFAPRFFISIHDILTQVCDLQDLVHATLGVRAREEKSDWAPTPTIAWTVENADDPRQRSRNGKELVPETPARMQTGRAGRW